MQITKKYFRNPISGKVTSAYNALLMAEQLNKNEQYQCLVLEYENHGF